MCRGEPIVEPDAHVVGVLLRAELGLGNRLEKAIGLPGGVDGLDDLLDARAQLGVFLPAQGVTRAHEEEPRGLTLNVVLEVASIGLARRRQAGLHPEPVKNRILGEAFQEADVVLERRPKEPAGEPDARDGSAY